MPGDMIRAALLMPDRVSPSAVAFDGEYFYAVNGIDPYVFVFTREGMFLRRCRTVRPYRTARYDSETDSFCCVGSGCAGKIYYLNGRFEETAYAAPEHIPCGGDGYVCDAFLSGNGDILNVAHRRSLDVFTRGGDYLLTMERARAGREFLLWAQNGEERATVYEEDGECFISVGGATRGTGSCVRPDSLFEYGGVLYGAFTQGYIYTSVSPLSDEPGAEKTYGLQNCSGKTPGLRRI